MEGLLILASLRDLAVRERLTEDLDYEPKLVSWVISLDGEGRFSGLTSTAMPHWTEGKTGREDDADSEARGTNVWGHGGFPG